MSADLFAQFGPSSGSNRAVQAASSSTNQQPDDPFAFLSTAISPAPTQQHFGQQASPQAQTQAQQASWPSLAGSESGGGAWTTSVAVPSQPVAAVAATDDDDDTWGDFEDAPAAPKSAPASGPVLRQAFPSPLQLQSLSEPEQQPKTRVVRSSTLDLMTNTLIHFGDGAPSIQNPRLELGSPSPVQHQHQHQHQHQLMPSRTAQKKKPQGAADPNVLFDADDYDGTEGHTLDDDDDDDDFEDDDFGAFESAQPPPPSSLPKAAAPQAQTAQSTATALVDLLSLSDPEPGPALGSVAAAPRQQQNANASSTQRRQPPAQLLSVLSFGSGGGGGGGGTSSTTSPSTTLASYPRPPKSPSYRERNPFPGLAVTTPNVSAFPTEQVANRTPSPVTVWPTFEPRSAAAAVPESTDEWDAWDLAETPGSRAIESASSTSGWNWEAEDTMSPAPAPAPAALPLPAAVARPAAAKTIPDSAPPPTNVPPPSILLSVFPALLALPDEALLKPIAGQPAEVRSRVLGDPRTIAFLRNYLQLVVVAARIVAGRKQRWHRDKFLSQSMSISVAGSGGSRGGSRGGMKLVGVDKTQGQREDREAADVVAAWRRHVGKIRSAVATANAALAAVAAAEHRHQEPLRIPELKGDTMPAAVTVAKMVPTAARPCVICGLRRDERVRGVDGDDVRDSFGEWWVEHWGHRACRNFWAEHEAALRSR